METTKHTKGEWKIEIESDGNIWIASDESTQMIANVCCGYNALTKRYEPEEEELSNANIIHAAPELLKSCNDFISAPKSKTMGYYSDEQIKAIEDMKKAIEKATK